MIQRLFVSCLQSVLMIILAYFPTFSKTDLRVFLLSGQSNMVGAGLANELPAYLNKTFDSVLVYLASEGDDTSKIGRWLTLGPGFGNAALSMVPNPGPGFGLELSMGKTLADSMPETKFAFIKDAVSGSCLNHSSGWLPPSSGGTTGRLYTNMMQHIDDALSKIDTTRYTLSMAGFVWLQGESDAMNRVDALVYETNLTNLIKDIRKKFNTDDLPVIVPMIDVQSIWTYNSIIRSAEIAVCDKLVYADTLDTKGFETDGVHYTTNGVIRIGTIAAQRWISMKHRAHTRPILHSRSTSGSVQIDIFPANLHCRVTEERKRPFHVEIRNLQGREMLSQVMTGKEFYLPRPGCGVWIVSVNGVHNLITVP